LVFALALRALARHQYAEAKRSGQVGSKVRSRLSAQVFRRRRPAPRCCGGSPDAANRATIQRICKRLAQGKSPAISLF
jgi:hypothetical protein